MVNGYGAIFGEFRKSCLRELIYQHWDTQQGPHLQLFAVPAKKSFYAGFAFGELARRAIPGAFEVRVALSASAPATKHEFLILFGKIRNLLTIDRINPYLSRWIVLIHSYWLEFLRWNSVNNRSYRYLVDRIKAGLSVHIFAESVLSALGPQNWLIVEVDQIVLVNIGAKYDIPPFATVPAVRATFRNKFFPAKADAAVPAVSGFGLDSNLVNEHDSSIAECELRIVKPAFRNWQFQNLEAIGTDIPHSVIGSPLITWATQLVPRTVPSFDRR